MTPSLASLPSPALHGWSFDRFDEMTDLVEEPSDLTLARHRQPRGAPQGFASCFACGPVWPDEE
jgi:hypothetical protein